MDIIIITIIVIIKIIITQMHLIMNIWIKIIIKNVQNFIKFIVVVFHLNGHYGHMSHVNHQHQFFLIKKILNHQ